jgi:tetratricopeptide (TPR) repeat protein
MVDLFDIQDDVAAAVIDALRLHIGSYPSRGRPTESAEAYGFFLKARIALNAQDTESAEADLRKAVKTDPDFAEAFELLSLVYWTADEPELMKDAAARALAADPDLALARALYIEGDTVNYSLADVIDANLRAARARPNDPATLRTLSWNLMITGYVKEALRVAERLAVIDPLSQIAHIRRAAVRRGAGRKSDATASLKIAGRLTGVVPLDWYFGEMYLSQQQDEKAIDYFEAAVRSVGMSDATWVREIVTGGREPYTGQALLDRQIPVVIQSVPPDADLPVMHLYLLLGHLDRYLEIILDEEQDHSMSSPAMYYVWAGMVYSDLGFTAHPRYLEIARLMGFVDVWDHRGPPDFCEKTRGKWACH